MASTFLVLVASTMAPALIADANSRDATLSISATVIRPVSIVSTVSTADGAVVTLRNTANAVVSADGGRLRVLDRDTTTVTATNAGVLRVTVQY